MRTRLQFESVYFGGNLNKVVASDIIIHCEWQIFATNLVAGNDLAF